jgi:chromate transporter
VRGAYTADDADAPSHGVAFRDAARFWIKLGFINFGGPTGQIAIMHEELVERRRWISESRFLHALNYCMLLPGPEAQQLAIYVGWLLHKVKGGLVAGIAFVLPAFFLILGLSYSYVTYGDVGWVGSVFYGLRAAVVGIVAAAAVRLASKAFIAPVMYAIALVAFIAVFFVHVPFPLIVIGAGVLGLVGGAAWPTAFSRREHAEPRASQGVAVADDRSAGAHTDLRLRRTLIVLGAGLAAWVVPLSVVALWRGADDTLTEEAVFFSQAALVTFGGAYAVLGYIGQAAVTQFGWLRPGQLIVGLGLAESTPGPLIMVTEFVGFVAAYQHPGDLDPFVAGLFGACVTTWATFAPCFLWIFLGAPFVERLRGNERLSVALSAITAAVVGVVLNLALWFAIHTLFDEVRDVEVLGGPVPVPDLASVDPFAVALAAIVGVGLMRYRWNVVAVVAGSAIAGLVHGFVT